jgi:hypothetical protein
MASWFFEIAKGVSAVARLKAMGVEPTDGRAAMAFVLAIMGSHPAPIHFELYFPGNMHLEYSAGDLYHTPSVHGRK